MMSFSTSLSDSQAKALLFIAQNGPSSVSGVLRSTGANLSTIQKAFKNLEERSLIQYKWKRQSEKGQLEDIFAITLPGLSVAIGLSDLEFVKACGPDYSKNYGKENVDEQNKHSQEVLDLLARNADLHWILKEISNLVGEVGGYEVCASGWFQILSSVRWAASVIDPRRSINDLPVAYLVVSSPRIPKEAPYSTFEFEFFSDIIRSWRPSERNLYDRDALANFTRAIKILRHSQICDEMLQYYLGHELESLTNSIHMIEGILVGEGASN